MKTYLIRRTAAAVATGALALALTACGGDDRAAATDDSPSVAATATVGKKAKPGKHNDADIAFAQAMIPHHRQAVRMAALAADHAQSAEVKALAAEIQKAQGPEIETMSGWLTAWGVEVPEGAMDHDMGSMEHGGETRGMMNPAELEALEKAEGEAFDQAFLDLMIRHHDGAVTMARTEKSTGAYTPATELAGRIVTSQTAEIEKMDGLLGRD
ncbi:hypothetical protein SRB5_60150 [Streptomyces sp. RB5]|uniref:DUF305 domain-containing protein n=1 Tax=Streptomyces smaragdinus TaxID=2585196 RepID=A0A7K0CSX3_9ACTN|nr:DUF305 domain-containing protein [Streptomyces smaragdinus]MQY15824.1 hypothetical protein [Streptomyces smaragdinus]